MITRQDLCAYLDMFLQVPAFNDFCINGLQVEGKAEIFQAATAVSASLATIEKAVELNIDALIVHHGLFWKHDSHAVVGSKKKKLELLLKHDISLFAYHLPLDAHREVGNNWKAAMDMGWQQLEPFGIFDRMTIGVKGVFEPRSRDQLQKEIEQYYGHPAHNALGGKEIVNTAALISGGAYKSLSEAASAGIDCFITGNFDEPAWHQAFEEHINFLALGHSATERVGPIALAEHIQRVKQVPTTFIDVANPF